MKKLTKEDKITQLKNQINNLNIIGKVLVQENNLIAGFKEKNKLVTHKDWFVQRQKLDTVMGSLSVVTNHFEDRTKAIEAQLKLLTVDIKETK